MIKEDLSRRLSDVRQYMKAAGADELRVAFDGSGDSGDIQGLTGVSDTIASALPVSVINELKNLAEEVINLAGFDYYNNDGGYGEVIFRLNSVEIEFNERVVMTELHEFTLPEEEA